MKAVEEKCISPQITVIHMILAVNEHAVSDH